MLPIIRFLLEGVFLVEEACHQIWLLACPANAGILEAGISSLHLNPQTTYESNVLFALRFMIDCDVVSEGCPACRRCRSSCVGLAP
jgi:hypothetical protein